MKRVAVYGILVAAIAVYLSAGRWAGPAPGLVAGTISVVDSGAGGQCGDVAISADGCVVAFGGGLDAHGRSLLVVSTHSDQGTWSRSGNVAVPLSPGDRADVTRPAVSADGRYVAVGGGVDHAEGACTNLWVFDRTNDRAQAIAAAGPPQADWSCFSAPTISADGRLVAFDAKTPDDSRGTLGYRRDVFLHDRHTGRTTLVSAGIDGAPADRGSWAPSISADGRCVAFLSAARNLVPDDRNRRVDVFVHEANGGGIALVSVADDGTQGNDGCRAPCISADGRFVAFESWADNLVAGDTNGATDVFVHDRRERTTCRVSVGSDGAEGNGPSARPSISGDGRYVAFEGEAGNLTPGDDNDVCDVFVHDRRTGETILVSGAPDGTSGGAESTAAAISADGQTIAFESNAADLAPGIEGRNSRIFVWRRMGS